MRLSRLDTAWPITLGKQALFKLSLKVMGASSSANKPSRLILRLQGFPEANSLFGWLSRCSGVSKDSHALVLATQTIGLRKQKDVHACQALFVLGGFPGISRHIVALVLFSFSVFFIDWLGWEDCIVITEYLLRSINNKKKCGGCILLLFVTSDLQTPTHFSSYYSLVLTSSFLN